MSNSEVQVPLYGRMLSAIMGGSVTAMLMTPFDVVKTRMQAQTMNKGGNSKTINKSDTFEVSRKRGSGGRNLYARMCEISQRSSVGGGMTNKDCVCTVQLNNRKVELMQDKRHLLGIRVGNGGGAGTCYATVAAMPQKVASDVGRQRITGTVSGFKMIAQNEGILRLWSGLGLGLTAGLPSTVVYFVGYDMLRNYVSTEVRKYPKLAATDPYVPLVTGCLARTLAVTLISPLELMRTQLQSSSSHNLTTVFRGVVASVRTNGLKSMYRGLGPTLLRDVPFSSIYWFSYERIKSSLLSNPAYNLFVSNLELGPGFVTSFVSGAVSGSIAAILTNPFDVAKTLYQSESSSQESRKLRIVLKKLVENEGYKSLYAGLAPRLMKIAPACAIMISSYELGKSYFV